METTEQLGGVLLASAVHEVKNILSQAVLLLDRNDCECQCAQETRLPVVRAANRLTQALMLYRFGEEGAIHEDSLSPQDFLEDIGLEARLLNTRQIKIDLVGYVRAPFWFFDRHATEIAVLSAVHNAFANAREAIRVSASEIDGYLVFSVEDDGEGYPKAILDCHARHLRDMPCGRPSARGTGLGLRFADLVARAHRDPKGRLGGIRLGRSDLGGARFEMWLP